jgi:hypothetical protein
MSFTQHFAAISRVFSHFMHNFSFQQCEYCEIGNVSMGFSKSLMPKISYKSLVFDSWFDKIFGICDLENPILTFPPRSILSLFNNFIFGRLKSYLNRKSSLNRTCLNRKTTFLLNELIWLVVTSEAVWEEKIFIKFNKLS